jgi:hypothetical protein
MPFNDIKDIETQGPYTIGLAYGSGATVITALIDDGTGPWYKSLTFYGREEESNEYWHALCIAAYNDQVADMGAKVVEDYEDED